MSAWPPGVGDRVLMSLPVGMTMTRPSKGVVVRRTPTLVIVREDGQPEHLSDRRFRIVPGEKWYREVVDRLNRASIGREG